MRNTRGQYIIIFLAVLITTVFLQYILTNYCNQSRITLSALCMKVNTIYMLTHVQCQRAKSVPTSLVYIHSIGGTPEVPSTPAQQNNLQELLSAFDKIVTIQHNEYYSS